MALVFTQLAFDAFQYPDGDMPLTNWVFPNPAVISPNFTFTITNHIAEQNVAHITEGSFLQWASNSGWLPGAQYAEVAIHNLAGDVVNNKVILAIMTPPDVSHGLSANCNPDGLGNIVIKLFDDTSNAQIGITSTVAFTADAKLRIEFINGILSLYYKGTLLQTVTGLNSHNTDTGVPLVVLEVSDNAVNSQISRFSAGIITSSTSYSVPDCRKAPAGPNGARAVQGTLIYDLQSSSNLAVPGTDSRVAGSPVDSRIVSIIPQNSRTPGTFGPGE